MEHVAIILIGGLLLVAVVAWTVKLMMKPWVIMPMITLMFALAWWSGLGWEGEAPNAAMARDQLERSVETE
jgi:hypothetical protein